MCPSLASRISPPPLPSCYFLGARTCLVEWGNTVTTLSASQCFHGQFYSIDFTAFSTLPHMYRICFHLHLPAISLYLYTSFSFVHCRVSVMFYYCVACYSPVFCCLLKYLFVLNFPMSVVCVYKRCVTILYKEAGPKKSRLREKNNTHKARFGAREIYIFPVFSNPFWVYTFTLQIEWLSLQPRKTSKLFWSSF